MTDPSGGPDSVAPRRKGVWLLFAAVAVVWYAADQLTKHLAVAHLSDRQPRHFIGSLLQLQLLRNPGAAFSMGTSATVVLSVLAIVATCVVLWFSRRLGDTVWAISLGLLLAGIVGNLTDRLLRAPSPLRGQVVDFLQLPHWPVFNIADVGINLGALLLLIQVLRGVAIDGRRGADGERAHG
ncbi:MAG: signal peptidase II [Nocardioidaceae bacterium]|nr:signal peptidase II [Nocardioidaceae bacterium]MCL2614658.1 signal peptidase II [Nocardioidaceae bacterium]